MKLLVDGVARVQRSQVSVQALSRLCSVFVFLLASWGDTDRLALVALQGALLAIPYTLIEALVGRPLSAGAVPEHWNVECWAKRVAAATLLPVGLVAFLSASVALPQTSVADRLVMIAPVLLQLPVEAMFWSCARTRSPARANLIPQLTALGTLLGATLLVAADLRVDVAAVPAQVAVLAWVLLRRPSAGHGQTRPGLRASMSAGSVYCLAAVVDLSYTIALPSVAGAAAGQSAVVVLRALDLAFGPFHVVLSASTREDIVAGRRVRWFTATRALTVATWLGVSAVVLASERVRGILATELTTLGVLALCGYCAYKLLLMLSTWASTRHMIHARPRRYLASAIGSRVIAFGGVAVALVWAERVADLMLQLLVCEALVAAWFAARMRLGRRETPPGPAPEGRAASIPAGPPPAADSRV
ncbi:hypothetical protein [Micromonospora sp. CPCC 205561]|uniref:hypothetical protein n=1 Tax=Micromonospora sp. CPCC 205561 TaxID=3122407 RepID=UPI002FF3B829